MAGHGYQWPLEAPRHVFHEARLAAASGALEQNRDAMERTSVSARRDLAVGSPGIAAGGAKGKATITLLLRR